MPLLPSPIVLEQYHLTYVFLETAGAASSLEIAWGAAGWAYGGGAEEQMPVANRFGSARVDDRIECPCLGQRAALEPASTGLGVRILCRGILRSHQHGRRA